MDTQKKDEKALVVLTQGQLKDIYEKAAAIGANEALKTFRQEQKKEYSRRADRRLRNTKLSYAERTCGEFRFRADTDGGIRTGYFGIHDVHV